MSVTSLSDNNFVTNCFSGYGVNRETTLYKFDNNYTINWQSEFDGNPASGDKSVNTLSINGFVSVLSKIGGAYESNIGIIKTDSLGQVTLVENEVVYYNNYELSNYPNPFSISTNITFSTKNFNDNVFIDIYNIKGQNINQLRIHDVENGNYRVLWNGTDRNNNHVATGVYLFRLSSDDVISKTNKMILKK